MITKYRIHALDNLHEIVLDGVPFQNLSQCPVCGSNNLTDIAVLKDSLSSAWCRQCTHAFLRKKPTDAWYIRWYTSAWDTVGGKPVAPPAAKNPVQHAKAVLKKLLRYGLSNRSIFDYCSRSLVPRAAVLDVGCGYGGYLLPFRRAGCLVHGIELSPHREEAARRLGIKTSGIGVEQLEPGTFGCKFDLVFSNHVLEHVQDLHAFFCAVRKVLKPGGWLYLAVPNFETYFLLQDFFFALHVHSFNARSLATLVLANGFEIHRSGQDHELRILARMSNGGTAPSPMSDLPSGIDIRPEWIHRRLFGPDFEKGVGKSVFAKAKTLRYPVISPYEYGFDTTLDSSSPKVIELLAPSGCKLPVEFESLDYPGRAPFWVK